MRNDFVLAFPAIGSKFLSAHVFTSHVVNDQETTDADLLQRIAAKDRAAFAQFYDKYSGLLFSITLRVLNNFTEAEDVLQDAFVQIWEKAAAFDPKLGKPLGWAITVARNRAIDRLRSAQRRAVLSEEAGAHFAIASETDDTANALVRGRENARLIQTALIELPEDQRKAIEMAFFSGLTQNEISEKTQLPLGTVKARIRRGLLKLRERLAGSL